MTLLAFWRQYCYILHHKVSHLKKLWSTLVFFFLLGASLNFFGTCSPVTKNVASHQIHQRIWHATLRLALSHADISNFLWNHQFALCVEKLKMRNRESEWECHNFCAKIINACVSKQRMHDGHTCDCVKTQILNFAQTIYRYHLKELF